jgi:hypothetical protein
MTASIAAYPQTSRRWATWVSVALLLALHIVNSTAWCIAFPLWQGADESAHFGLVQHIAELGRLPDPEIHYRSDEIVLAGELSDVSRLPFDPVQRQVFSDGPIGPRETDIASLDPRLRTSFELKGKSGGMHIPPLYHAVAAAFYRLAYEQDIIARAFAARLFSIAFSTLSVGFTYLLMRQVWPQSPAMWITVPLWVSLQPEFTFLVGGGNTDVWISTSYTVLLVLMMRAVRRGMGWGNAALMGLVLGCGLLVKPTILFIGPTMAIFWIWLGWRKLVSWRRLSGYAGLIGGIVLLLWGWWAVRSLRINDSLFYESPWATGVIPLPSVLDPDYPPLEYTRDYLISLWEGLFISYWASFGYLDTLVSPTLYAVLQSLCVASALGLGACAWRTIRRCRFDAKALIGVLLGVTACTPVIAMGYFGYRFWHQWGTGWPAMGRYLLVSVTPQMALLVWGLLSLLPRRWWPYAHVLFRLAALLFNAVCLLGFVLPRYYL